MFYVPLLPRPQLEANFSIEGWSIQAVQHAKSALATLNSLPDDLDCELTAQLFPGGTVGVENVVVEAVRLSQLLAQITELRKRADMRLNQLESDDGDKFSAVAVAAKKVLIDDSEAFSVNDLKDFKSTVETLNEGLSHLSAVAGDRQICIPRDVHGLQEQLKRAEDWMHSANLSANPAVDLTKAGDLGLVAAKKVRDELVQIESVLKASSVPFAGKVEELQVLLDGRGMPELLPDAAIDASGFDDLSRLTAGGWGSWTAEQFSSKSREINEFLSEAKLALEDLQDFFSKVGLAVNSTRSNLDGVEVLLSVAEEAPKELLSLRGTNIERPDFADVAIRAEDAFKSVTLKATKVAAKLHLDTLPSDDELVRHVKVFRRGNSIFNFLKSDWRQAKAAFNSCVKEAGKYDAAAMGEHFSAVLAWKTAETEFTTNDQFKTTLGVLFDGVKTDFSKIRRLHSWHYSSAQSLLTSDFSAVNLNSLPEQHLVQLAANTGRVRVWIGKLNQLLKVVAALPGLDPALQHARRLDELFVPLSDCEQWLTRGATILRQLVVPAASAQRASELVELKRRVSEHTDLLVSLIAAPKALCLVAEGLGLPRATVFLSCLCGSELACS